MTTKKPYDGLYFLPNPDDPSGFIIDYFTLKGEEYKNQKKVDARPYGCLLYTSPSPRDS